MTREEKAREVLAEVDSATEGGKRWFNEAAAVHAMFAFADAELSALEPRPQTSIDAMYGYERGAEDGYRRGAEDATSRFEEAIGNGYDIPASKVEKCEHGQFGWEDCIACYAEALLAEVAAIRSLSPNAGEG